MNKEVFHLGFFEVLQEQGLSKAAFGEMLEKRSQGIVEPVIEGTVEVGKNLLNFLPEIALAGGTGGALFWLLNQKVKQDRLKSQLYQAKVNKLNQTLSDLEQSGITPASEGPDVGLQRPV